MIYGAVDLTVRTLDEINIRPTRTAEITKCLARNHYIVMVLA
jgi:hypothetical protein